MATSRNPAHVSSTELLREIHQQSFEIRLNESDEDDPRVHTEGVDRLEWQRTYYRELLISLHYRLLGMGDPS